jgi:glyceraldehyde-3-phosphate dehydrogenase (ferredoxin)
METYLRVLMVDASSSYYKISKYPIDPFFGPVDLGLHLATKHNSLNIGTGLFSGSILPGSNHLVFTDFSPCWGGFYISSMGGAGLVFDNLGINMLSIIGRSPVPSLLYLNRNHREEIEVVIEPLDLPRIWESGRRGNYALMNKAMEMRGGSDKEDPRVLATGPASDRTDFGAIASVPVAKGAMSFVDTWAGR